MGRVAICLALLFSTSPAFGFCGFYVAKAGAKLFNKASRVVLVRDGQRTVITMASDYQGDPKEFALVVPVPTVLKRKQINVGEPKVIDHLDEYTAPRLVEYFDPDPCQRGIKPTNKAGAALRGTGAGARQRAEGNASLGVTVEASYEVGEYDILILSAKQSDGLLRWLRQQGYKMPGAARSIVRSYIKRGLKFFVAKVNLARQERQGYSYLRPLQMAFETARFELPLRLGTVNAQGPQELFVFALTRKGRVEAVNYQTRKIPTGMDLPVYVKGEFSAFYRAMFDHLVQQDEMRKVYMEYAWDMNWCDPCAADPLSDKELRSLGVFWVGQDTLGGVSQRRSRTGAADVFVTRLHLRYTGKTHPDDLRLQVTSDRNNYQGRYVLRHPYTGPAECSARASYQQKLQARQEKAAQNLARLTGWPLADIRAKMAIEAPKDGSGSGDWLDDLWK